MGTAVCSWLHHPSLPALQPLISRSTMSLCRWLLPFAAATSVFTLTGLSWLPSVLAGSSAILQSGRRAQLPLTSLAALSSALTLQLAVGALNGSSIGQAGYSSCGSDIDDKDNDADSDSGKDKDKDSSTSENGKRWLKTEDLCLMQFIAVLSYNRVDFWN